MAQLLQRKAQRFGHARGGFACGRGQRNAWWRGHAKAQQAQQFGHGGGFACARAAGDDGQLVDTSERCRLLLLAAGLGIKQGLQQARQVLLRVYRLT